MSELARRRNARDLWISRGHLAAAASGAASLAVASFAIGFFLGEHRRPPVGEPPPFAPDEGLVELLARIETTAALPGGVDEALTFPDLLRSEAEPRIPAPEGPREGRVVVGGQAPPFADAPPPGAFTVVVGGGADPAAVQAEAQALRHRGLAAWVSVAVVDGAFAYRIGVGGFADEAAAREALALARAAGVPGAVEPILLTPPPKPAPAAARVAAPAVPAASGASAAPAPAPAAGVDPVEVQEPGLVIGQDPAEVAPVPGDEASDGQ